MKHLAILIAAVALLLAGCGQFGNTARPGAAANHRLAGSALEKDFEGNVSSASSLPGPTPSLDFDGASLSSTGVPGDGAALSHLGVVAFNSLSDINMKGFRASFDDTGKITTLAIDEYGGNRDALFASLTAQVDLYKETLREMSADAREVAIEALKQAGNVPQAVLNAIELWNRAGIPGPRSCPRSTEA